MTTPEALAAAMQQRDADRILLGEMQQALRSELEKPPEQQNLDAVDELTAVICEMCGLEEAVTAHSEAGIETFRNKLNETNTVSTRNKPRLNIRWSRFGAVAASIAGALLVGGAATKMALGDRHFSDGISLTHGGIDITFSQSESVPDEEQPVQNDIEGIRAACESLGFTPLIPQYFPEGFFLEHTELLDDNPSFHSATFWWGGEKDKSQRITLQYTHYFDSGLPPKIGIPTDGYDLITTEIKGTTVYQVKENDYYNTTFCYDNTVYELFLKNVDTEICDQMLYSFFDSLTNS
ncbi:MAG: hypothetical protein J5753_01780 [Oscillospiraceae bacterium]|nr:hypothetical protein [Oscillospiraceae bacterium]